MMPLEGSVKTFADVPKPEVVIPMEDRLAFAMKELITVEARFTKANEVYNAASKALQTTEADVTKARDHLQRLVDQATQIKVKTL